MNVSNENMESLKALSNINIQISEATNRLIKLQEEETIILLLVPLVLVYIFFAVKFISDQVMRRNTTV
jgi:hypothetical protein